jgi:prepilin-type N-terminal cleavage/methylation domain-containing protein
MKRKGYSLIEVIVALSLLSILVLAMLPVLGSTSRQLAELEELRLQN